MKGAGFFALDWHQWPQACALGLNPAVAYVVLARGSDRSNRRTTWSAHAIAQRTNIARRRAHAAIDTLRAAGLLEQVKGGARPAYAFPPATDATAKARAPWAWLPNALVDGLPEAPGASPLERVRQTGDVMTLRLLVDLYGAHELRDDGGIDRALVWQPCTRHELGEYGAYRLLAFAPADHIVCGPSHAVVLPHKVSRLTAADRKARRHEYSAFWDRWRTLTQLGLVQWSTVLWESEAPDAEPIHPLAGPDPDESRIGRAAHKAATSMLETIGVREPPEGAWLVPVLKHVTQASVIGIARLRYRPHTTATAAWLAALREQAVVHEARYLALIDQLSAVG